MWLVNFSAEKTKAMLISNKKNKSLNVDLTFNNTVIDKVSSHKHLGLTISQDLSWSDHIRNVANNAGKRLDIISRLQYQLDRKTLEILYLSFVLPVLEYGNIVWDNCNNSDKESLEKIHKRAARIISGGTKGTGRDILLRELGWVSLEKRREFKKLVTFYKIINNLAPNYLCELIPSTVQDEVTYNLRSSQNLRTTHSRTTNYFNSFLQSTTRLWNDLDMEIRNSPSLSIFKSKLNSQVATKNELFEVGDRKVNILHARLRMECSSLNGHLYKNHIIDTPKCQCGDINEDNYHYFFVCPKFIRERDKLHNVIIQKGPFTLKTVLTGMDNADLSTNIMIMKAVQNYIVETKRFS